ncbi:MAG: alpha/beta hydrolase [Thermodesulfobacteriota bacterium]|nr:alpha/beta hydrolase [Thermodesulfobacteriota bacterium]
MQTIDLPGRGSVAYQWSGSGLETVVLINGSVFNYHQWDRQAMPVLNRGLGRHCRFLQYDYIGVGGSSAKTKPFSMLDLADELSELLDALSVGPVHLLGISKGSSVGQAFLIRHRDRIKSFCGLGNPNLNSPDLARVFDNFKTRIQTLEDLKELWPQRVNRENYLRIFNHVYVPIMFFKTYSDLSLVERLKAFIARRMVYPAMEGTFVQTMVDVFRYFVEGVGQDAPTFTKELPHVSGIPILLMNGTADTTTPVHMSRELAKIIPEAELVEFDGVTHMGPMLLKKDGPKVFERYVEYMKDSIRRR